MMNDRDNYLKLYDSVHDVADERIAKALDVFKSTGNGLDLWGEVVQAEIKKIWKNITPMHKKISRSMMYDARFCPDNIVDVLTVYLVQKCYKSYRITLKKVLY